MIAIVKGYDGEYTVVKTYENEQEMLGNVWNFAKQEGYGEYIVADADYDEAVDEYLFFGMYFIVTNSFEDGMYMDLYDYFPRDIKVVKRGRCNMLAIVITVVLGYVGMTAMDAAIDRAQL